MQKNNDIEKNKKIVLDFYQLAIHKKNVIAAAQYLADDYIQHNPYIPDGKEGFIKTLGSFLNQNPNLEGSVQRVIAENDLVMLHIFSRTNPGDPTDRGAVMVDIFRLENGKIVEHWDVSQPIPETSINGHSVY